MHIAITFDMKSNDNIDQEQWKFCGKAEYLSFDWVELNWYE